jgi:hypothetical protein
VPNFVGVFGQLYTFEFSLAALVKYAKFNFRGVSREERKIDPEAVPCRTQREGLPSVTVERRINSAAAASGSLDANVSIKIAPSSKANARLNKRFLREAPFGATVINPPSRHTTKRLRSTVGRWGSSSRCHEAGHTLAGRNFIFLSETERQDRRWQGCNGRFYRMRLSSHETSRHRI